jgi:hypothetical protein
MIDDQTVAYTLTVRTYFEDLKQVAAQLAGLLVLEASGAAPDHPMADAAERVYRQAEDGLRSIHVPARARKHHEYLLAAGVKLNAALHDRGDRLPLIDSAYADLRAASRALPGFQMISFERGCCAAGK